MGCGCQKREPARFVPYPAAMPTMRGPVPPPPVGLPPPNPLAVCMANRQSNVVAGENIEVNRVVNRCSGQNTYIVTGEVDKDWVESELAKKADKTYVNAELAKKADKTYVNTELSKKADKTYVNSELAKKADKTYVNTELAKKADKTYVNAELAKKSDKTYVDTELAKKADKTYVNTELAKKADKTYVNAELAKKADITYVDGKVAPKADKSYVDAQLATKASTEYVDSELAKKADRSYVDAELAKKANQADVQAALEGKVDKVPGKGLSSNDYTDEDKEKLTSIVWREPAEGGTALSLVTTGEKFTWDEKQDRIDYYLNNAAVEGGTLVITGSDGSTVSFAGTGIIDKVATPDGDLDIDGEKRVTIPLMAGITEEAEEEGTVDVAGLVRGTYKEFD